MKEITRNQSAVIAGIGLLLMAVFAIFATSNTIGMVTENQSTDALQEIAFSKFRMGIFFFVLVAVLDIIVAWALYVFLKPVSKNLSQLMALFRIVYAGLLFASLFFLLQALPIQGIPSDQIHTQFNLSVSQFNASWEASLIIFSIHLLLLGYLLLKAGYMKKILGILVLICGFGYLVDGLGKLLIEDYNLSLTMFTFVGEVVLLLWLLIKGRKIETK